jgi:hypothetical protein
VLLSINVAVINKIRTPKPFRKRLSEHSLVGHFPNHRASDGRRSGNRLHCGGLHRRLGGFSELPDRPVGDCHDQYGRSNNGAQHAAN